MRLLTVACLVALQVSLAAAFPRPDGYVNDFAAVLEDADETYLESYLASVKRDTAAEVVLVTVASLDGMTVEEYAQRLFADWGIGDAGRDDGILILVAPRERSVRIEVGYGLEGLLPDGLAGEIIRTEMLPLFRAGNMRRGIGRGVDRVARIVRREPAAAESRRALSPARSSLRQSAASDTSGDAPPLWALIPFFGLFVGLGAFAAGVGARTRTIGILIWGAGFAGIPLAMALASWQPLVLAALLPLGMAALVAGFRKGRSPSWARAMRDGARPSQETSEPQGWVMGGGSGSSGSSDADSASSSSSSSFGGGSSGGGGASGHW